MDSCAWGIPLALERALLKRGYTLVGSASRGERASPSSWLVAQKGGGEKLDGPVERFTIIPHINQTQYEAQEAEIAFRQYSRDFEGLRGIAQIRDFVWVPLDEQKQGNDEGGVSSRLAASAVVTEYFSACYDANATELVCDAKVLRWMSHQLFRGFCSLLEIGMTHGAVDGAHVAFRPSCDVCLVVPPAAYARRAANEKNQTEKILDIGQDLYCLGRFLLEVAGVSPAVLEFLDDEAFDETSQRFVRAKVQQDTLAKIFNNTRLAASTSSASAAAATPLPAAFQEFAKLLLTDVGRLRDLWESEWIQNAQRPLRLFDTTSRALSSTYLDAANQPSPTRASPVPSTGALHSVASLKNLYDTNKENSSQQQHHIPPPSSNPFSSEGGTGSHQNYNASYPPSPPLPPDSPQQHQHSAPYLQQLPAPLNEKSSSSSFAPINNTFANSDPSAPSGVENSSAPLPTQPQHQAEQQHQLRRPLDEEITSSHSLQSPPPSLVEDGESVHSTSYKPQTANQQLYPKESQQFPASKDPASSLSSPSPITVKDFSFMNNGDIIDSKEYIEKDSYAETENSKPGIFKKAFYPSEGQRELPRKGGYRESRDVETFAVLYGGKLVLQQHQQYRQLGAGGSSPTTAAIEPQLLGTLRPSPSKSGLPRYPGTSSTAKLPSSQSSASPPFQDATPSKHRSTYDEPGEAEQFSSAYIAAQSYTQQMMPSTSPPQGTFQQAKAATSLHGESQKTYPTAASSTTSPHHHQQKTPPQDSRTGRSSVDYGYIPISTQIASSASPPPFSNHPTPSPPKPLSGRELEAALRSGSMMLIREDSTLNANTINERIEFQPLPQDLSDALIEPTPFKEYREPLPATLNNANQQQQQQQVKERQGYPQSSDEYQQQQPFYQQQAPTSKSPSLPSRDPLIVNSYNQQPSIGFQSESSMSQLPPPSAPLIGQSPATPYKNSSASSSLPTSAPLPSAAADSITNSSFPRQDEEQSFAGMPASFFYKAIEEKRRQPTQITFH